MGLPLLERDVTRQVKDFLAWRGWRAVRMQRTVIPGAFQAGEPGMADYLFIRYLGGEPGAARVLWVEFKRKSGKLMPQQKQWAIEERARGAQVWTVSDLEQFQADYRRVFGGAMEYRDDPKQKTSTAGGPP